MKNKKTIYILLPVVLCIWGLVIYQFFSFSGTDVPVATSSKQYNIKPVTVPKRDTFAINVNYRDPFLGKMYLPHKKTVTKKSRVQKPVAPIVWPHITYKGIVSDNQNKTKVFVVVIKGQTYFMKEKDTEAEVTLKNGNREFIEVAYKGEKNKIVLQ